MIKLPNGCRCSNLKVLPKNWDKKGASIKKEWMIYYRFYDDRLKDQYPKGKLERIKGMNSYKTLEERRDATRTLLKDELVILQEREYNPITLFILEEKQDEPQDFEIDPTTPFCDALQKAYEKLSYSPHKMNCIKSTLKHFKSAANIIYLDKKPINEISRRHIIMVLDKCEQLNKKFTDSTHNTYRRDLMNLFNKLILLEAIQADPVTSIPIRDTIKKIPVLLTDDERIKIDTYLREKNFRFWILVNIFFHSGGRTTEIMKLRGKNVNLSTQKYKVITRKGKKTREVEHTIKDEALPFWQMAMVDCGPEDIVFSKGLMPGANPIRVDQVKRRWRYWIQQKLGIKCTWYDLKRLNSTETADLVGTKLAAKHNEHSEKVLIEHYDVNYDNRIHEKLKKVRNSFVPKRIVIEKINPG